MAARWRALACVCLAALFALAAPALAAPPAPAFSGPDDLTSDAGYVSLAWQSDEPVSMLIATRSDFSDARTVYRGSATGYFLSGLANGEYYFRLEGKSGAVSAPVRLEVMHQSLQRAIWLSAIGMLVTLAIVLTILRGARDE